MSELSEKDKALKAVLTLWNAIYNPSEFHILPNDIYKARKLLEEFIENTVASENAEAAALTQEVSNPVDSERFDVRGFFTSPYSVVFKGATFKVGGSILIETPSDRIVTGIIEHFHDVHQIVSFNIPGFCGSCSWDAMLALNPKGSM